MKNRISLNSLIIIIIIKRNFSFLFRRLRLHQKPEKTKKKNSENKNAMFLSKAPLLLQQTHSNNRKHGMDCPKNKIFNSPPPFPPHSFNHSFTTNFCKNYEIKYKSISVFLFFLTKRGVNLFLFIPSSRPLRLLKTCARVYVQKIKMAVKMSLFEKKILRCRTVVTV